MDPLGSYELWGSLGVLVAVGFVWIWRVERSLTKHEDKCSERYGLIFGMLRDIQERITRIEERTKP